MRAQMALWTVLAAPLLMGNDLRDLSADAKEILQNDEVLSIADDPLGRQGLRVMNATGLGVWRRELGNGDLAVLLLNALPEHANTHDAAQSVAYTQINNHGPHLRMNVTYEMLGWQVDAGRPLAVRDLYAHKNVDTPTGSAPVAFSAFVPFSGCRYFRVSRHNTTRLPLRAKADDDNMHKMDQTDASDEVVLFKAGEAGYHAINNPAMVRLRTGALLVFAEARGGNGGDGDKNDVGFKKSSSNGRTWSALRSIVPNNNGATTLGNLVPVVVNRTASEGGERVILIFCANNTLVRQIHSDDAGQNWSAPTDITAQVKLPGEGWVATGPANGIVLSSGRVLVPIDTNMAKASITIDYELVPGSQGRNRQCPMASLNVGVRGAEPSPLPPLHADSGSKAVVDPCTELTLSNLFKLQQRAYVMISDDSGASWKRGEALPLVASETAIAQLEDGSILGRARLGEAGWQDNCAAFAKSRDSGETWGPMSATLVGDPGAGAHGCIPTPVR